MNDDDLTQMETRAANARYLKAKIGEFSEFHDSLMNRTRAAEAHVRKNGAVYLAIELRDDESSKPDKIGYCQWTNSGILRFIASPMSVQVITGPVLDAILNVVKVQIAAHQDEYDKL